MTENEIFVKNEEEAILASGVPKKKTKKALSAERKQQLIEQLKRGRETAKQNRERKKQLDKEQKEPLIDAETKTEVEKIKEIVKDNNNKSSYELKNDLELLRKELSEIKSLLTKKEEKQIEKIIEKQEKKIEKVEEKEQKPELKLNESSKPLEVPKPIEPPKPRGLTISRFNSNFFGGF
jgi:hypothetical protein